MNSSKAKRAYVASLLALLLCVAMLVGTTYAWFTDEARTGTNRVQSGTLTIGLKGYNGRDLEGKTIKVKQASATGTSWVELSDSSINWEPGMTYELEPITIENTGKLALKFKLAINEETALAAGAYDLASVIDVYEGTTKLGTLRDLISDTDGAGYGILLPAGATATNTKEVVGSVTKTLKLHMQEAAGNDYQDLDLGTNGFSVTVYATQYTYEYDSTTNSYDKNAK